MSGAFAIARLSGTGRSLNSLRTPSRKTISIDKNYGMYAIDLEKAHRTDLWLSRHHEDVIGNAADVGMVFLASDGAAGLTGDTIFVDGGYTTSWAHRRFVTHRNHVGTDRACPIGTDP